MHPPERTRGKAAKVSAKSNSDLIKLLATFSQTHKSKHGYGAEGRFVDQEDLIALHRFLAFPRVGVFESQLVTASFDLARSVLPI